MPHDVIPVSIHLTMINWTALDFLDRFVAEKQSHTALTTASINMTRLLLTIIPEVGLLGATLPLLLPLMLFVPLAVLLLLLLLLPVVVPVVLDGGLMYWMGIVPSYGMPNSMYP